MTPEDLRKEFSVRENWRGQLILMVRRYDVLSHSGQWHEAGVSDLPQFFAKVNKAVQS